MKANSAAATVGFLDHRRMTAGVRFNRWIVPPAALAIHLCIGMAYGFSVFWLPLSRAVGITRAVACPPSLSFLDTLTVTTCDWRISTLSWMYTLFFVFLGSAAAIWGGWLEEVGSRKAGVVAAMCWCGGLVISAVGIRQHQIWMLWLGSGVIGGIGLGLGYISPVSILLKWFPDRPGMATGMAIMGFGGGAMIGSPLADLLMKHFSTPTSVGVAETFVTLAVVYFVFMLAGALGYRVPPEGWVPAAKIEAIEKKKLAIKSDRHVHLEMAWRTPQFWLLWAVLCLNVTAGIGILGMASPMLQEIFGGQLIGINKPFADLTAEQLRGIATIAAGFTGLLSLFNIGGRFFWASLSDGIGRKKTYAALFVLGIVLYASIPSLANAGNRALCVAAFCIILSMYGGGFATIPAYLADLFGTRMVGAIHGRLLTAWSTAGVLGPVLVTYIRDYQLDHGVARAEAYSVTMYILTGFLVFGCICNALVRPVADRLFMTDEQLTAQHGQAAEKLRLHTSTAAALEQGQSVMISVLLAWLAISIPLAWGVWMTVRKAAVLFH